ncbi:hypothetical protein HYPDE_26113 [Hyphomicrobium denitrificans 1NES1]|uniref:Uncharacterized protein n=1 Tax=Hyphomicrobium denitrificans 1NES1 TaxID=670307 RepID=N0B9W3_9HYPH|nr:hypothetical protein [Hyphomicrobium denitrificans]AGK56905.1 hypothetical protein HYPDE_26113 [Hyphomicrobium denitrificans 1NES1]
MAVIFVRYLPVFLLGFGVLAMILTARPFLIGKEIAQRHARFKSLRSSSPILNGLIAVSVVGKPVLEYFQKNDWNPDILPFGLALPITLTASASVFALIGCIVYFFFRAIRNINFFSNAKIRSPYAAFFMLVPITNIIVVPYLQYFTLHRSRLIASPESASKGRAMALVFAAYALFLTGLVYGRLSDDISQSTAYDPLSLLVLSLSAGGAGGILTSRVIRSIADAQDACARGRGLLPLQECDPKAERRARLQQLLQSVTVALLVIVAAATALFPQLPSTLAAVILQSLGL